MERELRQKVEEILGPIYCPEEYSCVEPDVEQYAKDRHGRFVVCLRSVPAECVLAEPRNYAHECRCVLREILLEKLH